MRFHRVIRRSSACALGPVSRRSWTCVLYVSFSALLFSSVSSRADSLLLIEDAVVEYGPVEVSASLRSACISTSSPPLLPFPPFRASLRQNRRSANFHGVPACAFSSRILSKVLPSNEAARRTRRVRTSHMAWELRIPSSRMMTAM